MPNDSDGYALSLLISMRHIFPLACATHIGCRPVTRSGCPRGDACTWCQIPRIITWKRSPAGRMSEILNNGLEMIRRLASSCPRMERCVISIQQRVHQASARQVLSMPTEGPRPASHASIRSKNRLTRGGGERVS
jgi:hypothetical protein